MPIAKVIHNLEVSSGTVSVEIEETKQTLRLGRGLSMDINQSNIGAFLNALTTVEYHRISSPKGTLHLDVYNFDNSTHFILNHDDGTVKCILTKAGKDEFYGLLRISAVKWEVIKSE